MRFHVSPFSQPAQKLAMPSDTARGTPAAQAVIEVVQFRSLPEYAAADVATAAQGTAALLRHQPGFRARWLLAGADGDWTDLVLWDSLHQAHKAADVVIASPSFTPFMGMIDGPTVRMAHHAVVWQMD